MNGKYTMSAVHFLELAKLIKEIHVKFPHRLIGWSDSAFSNRHQWDSNSATTSGSDPKQALCSTDRLEPAHHSHQNTQFDLNTFFHNKSILSSISSQSQAPSNLQARTTRCCGKTTSPRPSPTTWATTMACCWWSREVTTTSTPNWPCVPQRSLVHLSSTRSWRRLSPTTNL